MHHSTDTGMAIGVAIAFALIGIVGFLASLPG
jgi:hypothetical protein